MDRFSLVKDLKEFCYFLVFYFRIKFKKLFKSLEAGKSGIATILYRQRGRYSRPFVHSGMIFLLVLAVTIGPFIVSEGFGSFTASAEGLGGEVVSITGTNLETSTLETIKPRSDVIEYAVGSGDTISTIAEKFNVSIDTIRWENDLKSVKSIASGQVLKILPVTGISHKVKHGETVYSIAKKYKVDAQAIVNWPYNSFANDETFALAAGQEMLVPDGVMPKAVPVAPRPAYYAQVPAAGAVAGTGQFAWPSTGRISQGYTWYHKAIDIANRSTPDVVAADSGTVVVTGWPSPWAYGNRVIIDHANGYVTLYAHMSAIYVKAGQAVTRGQAVGRMGSTGRSTGTHLHFEIRKGGVLLNPLTFLK